MSTNFSTNDATRQSAQADATAEPLSPGETQLAENEASQRSPEEMIGDARARSEAERRRQAQLAFPPPPSWAVDTATPQGPDTAPAADEVTTWDFASERLPETLAFKRILVPLDGSDRAERALAVAARIAQTSRGSILLVQAVSPQAIGVSPSAPLDASAAPALDAASAYLKQVAHREELADVEVHRKALRGDSTAETLLAAIERYQCDLVVLCSHGRSGVLRWALGSIAQELVRHAPVPVLVLRPDGPLPLAERASGEPAVRALVTLDGSTLAEAALVPAARISAALAGVGRGEVHLLRVIDRDEIAHEIPVLPYRDPKEEALEEARTYLYMAGKRFQAGDLAKLRLKISWSMRADSDAVCAILDEAQGTAAGGETTGSGTVAAERYDLIAMATHGRSGLKLWAEGSATDRVLQTTHLPLLVVHPPEAVE